MNTISRHLLCLGALAGLLSACGSGSGLPGIIPTVSITSPSNNSSVLLSGNKQIAINFESNYVLKAPGTCEGLANCGHIYLLVDNTSCNQPNMPYNALVVASPAQADLNRCTTATGQHTITLELHHDDGTPVKNLVDNPVLSQVTVTAQ